MNEAGNALSLFGQATKAVRRSDLIDKEEIEIFGTMAMRAVDAALKEGDIHSAIDSMEKTKAIEDYIKYQVWHERVTMAEANRMVVWRLKILRKIGDWLGENLARPGFDVGAGRNSGSKSVTTKPAMFLSDIGIDKATSSRWQKIASVSEKDFDAFVKPFTETPEDTRDNVLTVNKVLMFIDPREPQAPLSEAIQALDDELDSIGLPPDGKKAYDLLRKIKQSTIDYVNGITDGTPLRHLFFMAAMYKQVGKGLMATANELDKRIANHGKSK